MRSWSSTRTSLIQTKNKPRQTSLIKNDQNASLKYNKRWKEQYDHQEEILFDANDLFYATPKQELSNEKNKASVKQITVSPNNLANKLVNFEANIQIDRKSKEN